MAITNNHLSQQDFGRKEKVALEKHDLDGQCFLSDINKFHYRKFKAKVRF